MRPVAHASRQPRPARPGALQRLQRLALRTPFVADLASREATVAKLVQQYVFLPANVRDVYLAHLLRENQQEPQPGEQPGTAIVFTASCRTCEVLACMLRAPYLPTSTYISPCLPISPRCSRACSAPQP